MRLNLLPQTVKKGTQTRTAVILSVVIALICIGGAFAIVKYSQDTLQSAKDAVDAKKPEYDKTVALQQKSVDQLAAVASLNRNVSLYQAMDKHIDEFPNLYSAVLPYIPNFFRLTELNATSAGPATIVTMTGVISTYQQYADLMLALLRIPKPYGQVVSISRAGYQHTEMIVPPIDEQDQNGRPRRPGANPVPDDPLQRLEYYINQGATTQNGYLAIGNYGSGQSGPRGPRLNESEVTVRLVLPYTIQTPDPKATLSQAGGAPAAGGGQAPGGGPAATTPGGGGRATAG